MDLGDSSPDLATIKLKVFTAYADSVLDTKGKHNPLMAYRMQSGGFLIIALDELRSHNVILAASYLRFGVVTREQRWRLLKYEYHLD